MIAGNTEGKQEEIQDNKLYIIKDGITNASFELSNMDKFNVNTSSNDYSVVIRTDNIQHNRAAIAFRNIDLTEYSKVGIDYKVTNKTGDPGFTLALFQNDANVNADIPEKATYLIGASETSKERSNAYVEDLPSGIHTLSLLKGATLDFTKVEYNVYSLWLEKSNGQKLYIIQNGVINNTYELLSSSILNEASTPNTFGLTNATNSRAGVYINNQEITGYSKIGVDYEVESKTGNAIFVLGLFEPENNILTADCAIQKMLVLDSETGKTRTTDYLENVEDGTYKLCIYKNATSANTLIKYKIYNLWLEK